MYENNGPDSENLDEKAGSFDFTWLFIVFVRKNSKNVQKWLCSAVFAHRREKSIGKSESASKIRQKNNLRDHQKLTIFENSKIMILAIWTPLWTPKWPQNHQKSVLTHVVGCWFIILLIWCEALSCRFAFRGGLRQKIGGPPARLYFCGFSLVWGRELASIWTSRAVVKVSDHEESEFALNFLPRWWFRLLWDNF